MLLQNTQNLYLDAEIASSVSSENDSENSISHSPLLNPKNLFCSIYMALVSQNLYYYCTFSLKYKVSKSKNHFCSCNLKQRYQAGIRWPVLYTPIHVWLYPNHLPLSRLPNPQIQQNEGKRSQSFQSLNWTPLFLLQLPWLCPHSFHMLSFYKVSLIFSISPKPELPFYLIVSVISFNIFLWV